MGASLKPARHCVRDRPNTKNHALLAQKAVRSTLRTPKPTQTGRHLGRIMARTMARKYPWPNGLRLTDLQTFKVPRTAQFQCLQDGGTDSLFLVFMVDLDADEIPETRDFQVEMIGTGIEQNSGFVFPWQLLFYFGAIVTLGIFVFKLIRIAVLINKKPKTLARRFDNRRTG